MYAIKTLLFLKLITNPNKKPVFIGIGIEMMSIYENGMYDGVVYSFDDKDYKTFS
jgi:hypothetical protein